jgi:SAM-dependent methyltransferase
VRQAGAVEMTSPSQYATDRNLAARQRLWDHQRGGVKLLDWVLDLVDWGTVGPVLDVGCGNGHYLDALHARAVDAIGCDLSLGMLRSSGGHRLVNADADCLPFGDGHFGAVLAAHMLYHVADPAATARELRRVLTPGGVLIAVTNGGGHLRSLRGLVESTVTFSDPGWRMVDPATRCFSLENGARQLAAVFESAEVVRPHDSGRVVVDEASVITDYLSSVADTYGTEVSQPWTDVVEGVRRQVQQVIDRDGNFVTGGDVGAVICT